VSDVILWHSDHPWSSSSVGQQTATFVPRLQAAGFDIACSAQGGLDGTMQFFEGVPVLPSYHDVSAAEGLLRNARLTQPDLVVLLMTPWGYHPQPVPGAAMASFCPVEHDPLPNASLRHFEISGATPLAVTRDGERLLREAGLDPIYVPHGIDTNVFKPSDRAQARAHLDCEEDAFVVGMVGANKDDRKSFPEAFAAFAAFHEEHPDARLLVHSLTSPRGSYLDLQVLARGLGIYDAVIWPNPDLLAAGMFNAETMAACYAAMNVFLAPSRGEGFGLPLLEAQACGVPVIVTDFGSMPEVGAVGWKVGGQPEYSGQPVNSWFMCPSIDSIRDALEAAYEHDGSLAVSAREHALQYDADLVAEKYLVPALSSLLARTPEPVIA
jgi:glycosyltransferase involved in cell wall biosynthesis